MSDNLICSRCWEIATRHGYHHVRGDGTRCVQLLDESTGATVLSPRCKCVRVVPAVKGARPGVCLVDTSRGVIVSSVFGGLVPLVGSGWSARCDRQVKAMAEARVMLAGLSDILSALALVVTVR